MALLRHGCTRGGFSDGLLHIIELLLAGDELLAQSLDLAAAIEEARLFARAAAARQRTARREEFARQRHDAQAVVLLLGEGERVVERVDDEDASEQEVGRLAAGIVDLDELIGPADCALAVLGLLLALLC